MNHDPAVLASFEREVGALTRRLRRVLGDRARAVHPDLPIAGYLVLGWLTQCGPGRSSELVDALGIDKAVISRQVQQLLDLGLIEKCRDPEDGRAAILSIRPAARARLEEISRARAGILDNALADWSDVELQQFVDLLARYNRAMERPS